uniref:NADH dehydrogenase [ubiquinone] iron-sulfur protein 6, mitochondrial n=1 Tax=Alona affinis TaxID=381656 RepID=A0A9N6ZES9_9CRUS|nr:EOG090X0NBY [Alona affinis]
MAAPLQFRLVRSVAKNWKISSQWREPAAFSTSCVRNENSLAPTHTGQKWDEKDSRMARFDHAERQINSRFAIDLIAEVPPKECKSRVVACDGGGGPLGHPKVYINLDKAGNHSCGYCGLRFFKADHHH